MAASWSKQGVDYYPVDNTTITGALPKSVLKINFNSQQGFWLSELREGMNFPLPEKVYGTETEFIELVSAVWEGTPSNMGLLLNGIQGTGE